MSETRADSTGVGSLIQVAAVGPQDDAVHGDGSAFSFSATYSRHTPFGIVHDLESTPTDVRLGSKVTYKIPKVADMIYRMYLSVSLPNIYIGSGDDLPAIYKNHLAFLLVDSVTLRAGGTVIQEYSGEYLYARHHLTVREEHREQLRRLLGIRDADYSFEYYDAGIGTDVTNVGFGTTDVHTIYRQGRRLYIPLPIWDEADVTQFFPCSPLYSQEIELTVAFRGFDKLYIVDTISDGKAVYVKIISRENGRIQARVGVASEGHPVYYEATDADGRIVAGEQIPPDATVETGLDVEYIALHKDERQTIVQNPQEYLYTTVLAQKERLPGESNKIQLDFTLPVKQLIWFVSHEETLSNFNIGQFLRFETGRLILGDQESGIVMQLMDDTYFSYLQPYRHCHRVPDAERHLYSYSFALLPNSGYNTGAVHFGKLAKRILEINGAGLAGKYITIFATCYNVLETDTGRCAVRFSQ